MHVEHLWLTDFRSYVEAELEPAPEGITVVTGGNGSGKTNLIEAVGYLATLRSLRASPPEAMVRIGSVTDMAVVRASVGRDRSDRSVMIEAELHAAGRDRVHVAGRPLRRSRDLLGVLPVTVFSPDDLVLVKGGPSARRGYLDDLMVSLLPRRDQLLSEMEQILRQRNALLKSAFTGGWRPGRALPEDVAFTLDVWDAKLATTGEQIAAARAELVASLDPLVDEAYATLAGGSSVEPGRPAAAIGYRPSWPGALADALIAARDDDLRRGITTVGPHRDDLELRVDELPARTHASQGEQRTLALALRLAGHRLLTASLDTTPVLLLDDVFSELDPARATCLLHGLPPGQAILTTAGVLPAVATHDVGGVGPVTAHFRVEDGKILS